MDFKINPSRILKLLVSVIFLLSAFCFLGQADSLEDSLNNSELYEHQQGTLFYFVRHGETDWNKEKKIQGHYQTSLNETGKAQALSMKNSLASYRFDACYCSDMMRVRETADILLEEKESCYVTDQRLRERNAGEWVGANVDDYKAYREKDGKGIESDSEIRFRIYDFIQEVSQKNRSKNVLVVTHGGILRNIVAELTGKRTMDVKVQNTALIQLLVVGNSMKIVSLEGVEYP